MQALHVDNFRMVCLVTVSVAAEAGGDALSRLDGVARPGLDVEAGEGHGGLPQARLRRRFQPGQARRQAARPVGRAAQLGTEAAPVEPGGAAPSALQRGQAAWVSLKGIETQREVDSDFTKFIIK